MLENQAAAVAWKDVGEDMGYREERHQAARRVLDRRLRKGTSLVLYLRLFGGVEVLQDTDAGAYLTENYLLDHWTAGSISSPSSNLAGPSHTTQCAQAVT